MEHGHVSPNLEIKPSENYSVGGSQDEGGVDTNIAGSSESKKLVLIKLKTNQSTKTTKLKNNNDNIETLEFGNNNTIDITIQDKKDKKDRYICKFCSQVFDKHQALGGHMNGHSKDQRNLEKFEKLTTWIHATYPSPPNTTLTSEAELQNIPANGVACNSYNVVEVGDVYNQLGGQWTTQQSTQQIQLSQVLHIQQRQQRQQQIYQVQEPQSHQTSQRLQSNQVIERPQSIQALHGLQNYQAPQGLQNDQTPQGLQNYQTPQQFQNYQTPQGLRYYQASQRPQYYQAPQRFQNYQTPHGPQSYQTLEGSQSRQAPQGSQSYQILPGSRQKLVVDANNQQKINLNSKTSNKPTSLTKVPLNEKKSNLPNSQVLHFQEGAQDPQRYMPNPNNLRHGDRLSTGPFINEQLNKKYYAQLGLNVLRRSNQMISTPHNYDAIAQCRPANPPNTSGSFNQSKDD